MKKIIIGIIIFLIIGTIGVGAYFVINNYKESNEVKNNTSEENKTKEKEDSKKITKITAEKEMYESAVGKYNAKIEVIFENGKPTSYKCLYYDIKDGYILDFLKEALKKAGLENRVDIKENSIGFEVTGEEVDKYLLVDQKNKQLITRNYLVSQYKKAGYTVTIEGDDSFLSDSNEEANSDKTEENNQSNNAQVESKNFEDEINKAVEEAQSYLNSEEAKKAQEEAEQKANEYIKNNQEQIEAAKKKAEQLSKQYGF